MKRSFAQLLILSFPAKAYASQTTANFLVYSFLSFLPTLISLSVLFLIAAAIYKRFKPNQDSINMNGIERNFKEALQVLAASPADQVKCTEPGDVPEEIWDDFMLWAQSYKQQFSPCLDDQIALTLDELISLTDSISDSAFSETNLKSMQRPEWEPLRTMAQKLLRMLEWPNESPPPYEKQGNGTYIRITNNMK